VHEPILSGTPEAGERSELEAVAVGEAAQHGARILDLLGEAGSQVARIGQLEVLQQVGDIGGGLVEDVTVDLDAEHLRLVLVLADLDIAVSLVVRPFGVGDLNVA